jgi:hypothetical protein
MHLLIKWLQASRAFLILTHKKYQKDHRSALYHVYYDIVQDQI